MLGCVLGGGGGSGGGEYGCAIFGLLGALGGVAGAIAVDAAVLAREEEEPEQVITAFGIRMTPTARLDARGGSVGVSGAF